MGLLLYTAGDPKSESDNDENKDGDGEEEEEEEEGGGRAEPSVRSTTLAPAVLSILCTASPFRKSVS